MKTCSKCSEERDETLFYKGRNECKPCYSIKQAAYYLKNSDKIKAKVKAWAAENPDKVYAKRYPDRQKAYMADYLPAYREANLEALRAKEKAYNDSHKEVRAAWTKANHEKLYAKNRERRALLRGASADLTVAEWQAIWAEFDGLCVYCGDLATSMDHIVPLRPRKFFLTGNHTKNNVLPACKPCNDSKGDRDPLIFLFERREVTANASK